MKLVTVIDAFVILILSTAVVLGLYVMPGCTAANFDTVENEHAAVLDASETPDSGDDGGLSDDSREDASQQDGASDAGRSDSACLACDTSIEDASETSVVVDSAPTSYAHRTATGDLYESSIRPGGVGGYSSTLFSETISKIESFHPGTWSAPYETKCDLSSEGHGLESCQTITTSSMGIVICPFGISYVNSFASCPPMDAKVTWW